MWEGLTFDLLQSTAASGGYEELSDEEVSFDGDFDAQEVGVIMGGCGHVMSMYVCMYVSHTYREKTLITGKKAG